VFCQEFLVESDWPKITSTRPPVRQLAIDRRLVMKRRNFLRRAGLTLAAWGVSDLGLSLRAQRYQQALAIPTTRKLALLVGINDYPGKPLYGCLTDVTLQRELLIHRFGFNPTDIVTLTDGQASREAIATAFQEHLINQAKSDHVVVIHFSGYSRVMQLGATTQVSWVTAGTTGSDDAVEGVGLSHDTLKLLLRSLPTEQVTTVIDTAAFYPGAALQGNLRVRALPPLPVGELDAAEWALQDRLLGQLKLDRSQWQSQLPAELPGIVLAAADDLQLALEAQWNGFSAGVFTAALTEQLWRTTPATTLRVCLSHTLETLETQVHSVQHPRLQGQKQSDRPLQPYLLPRLTPSAEGVITAVADHGKVGQLWLGGLPIDLLDQIGSNALFTLVADPSQALQVLAREGLTAKVRGLADGAVLEPGQLVHEAVRLLPRNLGLTVALDGALDRIERIDATSAFSALPRLNLVAAGEPADYVFGKLPKATTQVAALPSAPITGLVTPSSYGLFSPAKATIANTPGEAGEAVKLAVRRLLPQLQTLLATKLLRFTVNESSSRVAVRASLEVVGTPTQIVLQRETTRVVPDLGSAMPTGKIATVPVGSRIQYRLQNLSAAPLYFLLLGLDTNGKTFYYAQSTVDPADRAMETIAPNATLTLPPPTAPTDWIVRSPIGLSETYLICSHTPFDQTQPLLPATPDSSATFRPLPSPLEVTQAILQDLHQGDATDAFALDVKTWATLRFIYQVA
jgi:hypothetical protein